MHWRNVFKLAAQPDVEQVEKEEQKGTQDVSELSHFPPVANTSINNKHLELPAELAHLIEAVGRLYKADPEDIDDMKAHVLQFINNETNGLLIALNGFRQLVDEFAT